MLTKLRPLTYFEAKVLKAICKKPRGSEMKIAGIVGSCMADAWVTVGVLQVLGLVKLTTRAKWAATPTGRKAVKEF